MTSRTTIPRGNPGLAESGYNTYANVAWIKQGYHWFNLLEIAWSDVKGEEGVYVIWHPVHLPRAVYVGQGDLEDRFSKHRNDPEILEYAEDKLLYVTWAHVLQIHREGVERYLADTYRPLVGKEWPKVPGTFVNLPEI
ncbi:MAG: hypothetical protein OXD31_16825 [Chloroflexi bacterium]|nr:hypothetical protein [Chloroflexota bacterium]